jgi:uncharacterized protein YggU (UPF0235/DUF167 family)
VTDRPYLSEREGGVLVRVRLQPRAHGDEIVGERAGVLVVRLDGVRAAAVGKRLP